ncbi:hypothetical protein WN943_017686 [Citrus x changshan-huyou]
MADEQNPSDALPNGWIAVIEEGDTVKSFTNIETHQTFNTREELNRYVAYASRANLPQRVDCNQPVEVRCTRCWCTGHTAPECNCSDRLVKYLIGHGSGMIIPCEHACISRISQLQLDSRRALHLFTSLYRRIWQFGLSALSPAAKTRCRLTEREAMAVLTVTPKKRSNNFFASLIYVWLPRKRWKK